MEKGDKGSTLTRMGVSGWMFLLVPAYPGCPGQTAVKWLLLLLAISTHVYLAKNAAYFPFNSLLSFQRLCRLLWGYHFHFVDSSHASNSSVIPVPSWHVSNTSATATCIGLLNWQTFCFSCQHLEVLGMSIPSCKPLKQLYKEHD